MTWGDQDYENIRTDPLAYTGDVVVDLVFEDGSAIRATADGLRLGAKDRQRRYRCRERPS